MHCCGKEKLPKGAWTPAPEERDIPVRTAPHTIYLRQKHPQKRQIVAFDSISPALTNRKPAAKRSKARSIQPTAPEPF